VDEMMRTVSNHVNRLIALDARSLAREAGSELAVNMVMVGALMRHGEMPFGREVVEKVLNTKTKKAFLEMNLQAFDLGFQAQ
jgi:indolepyruvate ferredoxin oxidoreductase beta subunit